ncbi:hypothetical protein CSB20_01120 [bacterium DOLZORAL124_64_63]|nr:MAG: hypothetical protein CSB20_01120 [bacterium DOLZORAL124_64_63]
MKEEEYKIEEEKPPVLREAMAPYLAAPALFMSQAIGGGEDSAGNVKGGAGREEETGLVRTQVYLTPEQRDFLRNEGRRKGVSMAGALRQLVEERMRPGGSGWEGNPLLDEVAEDASFTGAGSGNVDEAVYGSYVGS